MMSAIGPSVPVRFKGNRPPLPDLSSAPRRPDGGAGPALAGRFCRHLWQFRRTGQRCRQRGGESADLPQRRGHGSAKPAAQPANRADFL